MLPQASVSSHGCPMCPPQVGQSCPFSCLELSHTHIALALNPAFQCCTTHLHGRPSERLGASPMPEARLALVLYVHGSWAGGPAVTRQPCEEGGPVPSRKLCHEAACPSPLPGSGTGPAWACFHARVLEPTATSSPSAPLKKKKSFQNGRMNLPCIGGEIAAGQLDFHHPTSASASRTDLAN